MQARSHSYPFLVAFIALVLLLLPVQPAFAQFDGETVTTDAAAEASTETEQWFTALPPPPPERPRLLVPLYVSLAGLQISDAASTVIGVKDGRARELNPLVEPVADSWAGMVLLKSGATAVTILAVEHLWKKNRTAAVATMIAANVGYSLIVAHNMRVLRAGGR